MQTKQATKGHLICTETCGSVGYYSRTNPQLLPYRLTAFDCDTDNMPNGYYRISGGAALAYYAI